MWQGASESCTKHKWLLICLSTAENPKTVKDYWKYERLWHLNVHKGHSSASSLPPGGMIAPLLIATGCYRAWPLTESGIVLGVIQDIATGPLN